MLKKVSFLLSLLLTTIYIFGQTATFHDEISRVFPFSNAAVTHCRFHAKSMPDDGNVIAIFYGPMLLAFESQSELVLRSHKDEILQHIVVDNISQRTFKLTDNGNAYLLRPLFDIGEQSYGVYATLRDY